MNSERICLFGIPFDNVSLQEAGDRIIQIAKQPNQQNSPAYVATVNTDFLANALSCFSYQPKNPHLLQVLRKSALVTADGMPLLWLSKLCYTPLKERVTGADLVPLIATLAAEHQLGLYLLGGEEAVTKQTAKILKEQNPQLKITGISSPYVITEGPQIKETLISDIEIVKTINQSKANILLIAFGNPKQELWFHRVKHLLTIPVAVGIGGSFNFVTGKTSRAPQVMQKAGLEWLYRLYQEPQRLWKRYAIDLFKLASFTVPLLLQKALSFFSTKRKLQPSHIQKTKSHYTLQLPPQLQKNESKHILSSHSDALKSSLPLFVDFTHVHQVDPHGTQLLSHIWLQRNKYGYATEAKNVGYLLKQNLSLLKIWDLIDSSKLNHLNTNLSHINPTNYPHISTHKHEKYNIISIKGELSYQHFKKDIEPSIDVLKHHIIDLSNCNSCDPMSYSHILELESTLKSHNKSLVLCGINSYIAREIKALLLWPHLVKANTINDALQSLK